ncbi:MAG: hypothetical protein A2Z99_20820 [Treponema sp. GWB1_62_6]|nr:MAG: hypothetical protein A2001_16595 [Treponema sp. GWC1_61_84]OHE63221.1 MAG: hypothetical protein A2Z99_20820 [Treponema sp. GWB1_62_6]HCM27417.1 LacI family transcriptional regulator [Treponema sp.]
MTVKEIAELAGVSIGTVDRVLHGRGRFSAETKARIDAIVESTGFTPNPIARRLKRSKPYRFSVLLPNAFEDSGYWGLAAEGIAGAADEIKVFGVETRVFEFDRYDPSSFKSASAEAMASVPDGVLLAPVMPVVARPFAAGLASRYGTLKEGAPGDEGARDKISGVPYAFFDADLPEASPICSIGQDPFRGGRLAGRLARLFAAEAGVPRPRYAVLNAHVEDLHIKTRRDGFLSYAAEVGMDAVTTENVDMESDAGVEELLARLLEEDPELTGVFVTSSSSHRVGAAVRASGLPRRFIVVGYDLVPENERMLRGGGIDAIISQRPEIQARRGLLDLYRAIVLGRPVERRVDVPIDLYLKENLPSDEGIKELT